MSEERHLIQLNPTKTKEYIDDQVEGSPIDRTGSQPGRRYGTLRGCPSITRITFDRYKRQNINTLKINTSQNIYVEGYNMYFTSNIYLSGSTPGMFDLPTQKFSYFEDNFTNRISTENPSFSAVQLSGWTVINQTNMYFNIPAPRTQGTIDIIMQGPAGYTISSQSGSEYTNYYISIVE